MVGLEDKCTIFVHLCLLPAPLQSRIVGQQIYLAHDTKRSTLHYYTLGSFCNYDVNSILIVQKIYK